MVDDFCSWSWRGLFRHMVSPCNNGLFRVRIEWERPTAGFTWLQTLSNRFLDLVLERNFLIPSIDHDRVLSLEDYQLAPILFSLRWFDYSVLLANPAIANDATLTADRIASRQFVEAIEDNTVEVMNQNVSRLLQLCCESGFQRPLRFTNLLFKDSADFDIVWNTV
jgi:hypothetical protein